MLRYLERKKSKIQIWDPKSSFDIKDVVWVDLLTPTREEEKFIEAQLGFILPTRADMVEIELSSRLYTENNEHFMTVTMIAHSDSDTVDPLLDPVTFVLSKQQLITIRYIEPQSFRLFDLQAEKLTATHRDPVSLLATLLDITIDRLADILELVGHRLDTYSQTIFNKKASTKHDYHQLMQQMGAIADLNTKARESLVTFHRLLTFFAGILEAKLYKEKIAHLSSITTDIIALSDHASFLSTKINFLLDATLGMVNIEQNGVIKTLSIAAVIFLPPTLIASIYGMNFHNMPELSWQYGYFVVLGIMSVSTWLPYKYFKYRKWL